MPQDSQQAVSDKILTAPNVITLVRFLLIPLFVYLRFCTEYETAALVVFVVAACTDWVDGQVARRTNQVSRIGMLFDPFVDRFLLAVGVLSVCALGRLPIWVVVVVIVRDLALLIEGRISLYLMNSLPRVSYVGKAATAFLLFGFSFLLLGVPSTPGLGIVDVSWLPGLNSETCLFGIWLIYIGLILSLTVFFMYQYRGITAYLNYRKEHGL